MAVFRDCGGIYYFIDFNVLVLTMVFLQKTIMPENAK